MINFWRRDCGKSQETFFSWVASPPVLHAAGKFFFTKTVVTVCKECIKQSRILFWIGKILLVLWRAASHLAPLQRPVMVISIQSAVSMSVWVYEPIRVGSDDVKSGWVSWLMQTYSYTPSHPSLLLLLQSLGKGSKSKLVSSTDWGVAEEGSSPTPLLRELFLGCSDT